MRTILAVTFVFCGLMLAAFCTSASAASKNPDYAPRSSHYKHKLQKRAEQRPDPELGIHGFIGAGGYAGPGGLGMGVGRSGQAGFNW